MDERTLADVLRDLGDVSPDRVLWKPPPGRATERHLLRSRQCELVDGMLVRKVPHTVKGILQAFVGSRLTTHVGRRLAGTMGGGPYRLAPGLVRLPDVGLMTWDRLRDAGGEIPDIAPVGPDLAVEIIVPGLAPAELDRKRREFFAGGCRLWWELDFFGGRTAVVYTRPDVAVQIAPDDDLDGGDVVPGFRLPLAEAFGVLDPPRRSG